MPVTPSCHASFFFFFFFDWLHVGRIGIPGPFSFVFFAPCVFIFGFYVYVFGGGYPIHTFALPPDRCSAVRRGTLQNLSAPFPGFSYPPTRNLFILRSLIFFGHHFLFCHNILTDALPPRFALLIGNKKFHMTGRCVIFCGRIQTVIRRYSFLFSSSSQSAPDITGWGLSPRGAGFLFGADITKKFAHNNGIDLIARAHQLAMEGYKLMFDQTIVTVWSAPNYCYRCGNVASILELDEHLAQEYKVFSHAPLDVRSIPAKRPPADYFL